MADNTLQAGGKYGEVTSTTTFASRQGVITTRVILASNCELLTCSALTNTKDKDGNVG
jgi:hypothetical protein